MANSSRINGFTYIFNLTGGGEYVKKMTHPATDNVAIGAGDLVTRTGAANVVEQYDNADPVWGLATSYVPLSTVGYPSVVFLNHTSVLEVEEDSDGGSIAAASEGLNAEVVVAAANTITGFSQMTLDSSTVNTTNSFAMRLFEPSRKIGNTVALANSRWYVTPLELDIAEAKAGV